MDTLPQILRTFSLIPVGSAASSLRTWANGTWQQTLPWGDTWQAVADASSPLMEVSRRGRVVGWWIVGHFNVTIRYILTEEAHSIK